MGRSYRFLWLIVPCLLVFNTCSNPLNDIIEEDILLSSPAPDISVSFDGSLITSAGIALPPEETGETSEFTLSIQNKGNSDLLLYGEPSFISYSGDEVFSVDAIEFARVASGETLDCSGSFSPDAAVEYSGVITIVSNDDDESPFHIPITGRGVVLEGDIAINLVDAVEKEWTNDVDVVLTLTQGAESTFSEMMIGNSGDFSGSIWEDFGSTKPWTLSGGDGTKTVFVKFRDASGPESSVFQDSIKLDTTAPAKPDAPALNNAHDTGVSSSDGITSLSTALQFDGTSAEEGAAVSLRSSGSEIASGTAGTGGNWSITGISLAAGSHILTVIQTDPAGNSSAESDPVHITVDTTPPDKPGAPDLSAADDSGSSNDDNITNVTGSLEFSGDGAEFGAALTLRVGGIGTAAAAANGFGEYTFNIGSWTSGNGTFLLDVVALDTAGNSSGPSDPLSITIDTEAPAPPLFLTPRQGEYLGRDGTSALFSWSPAAGAAFYDFQVSTDKNFGSLSVDASGLTGTSRSETLSASTGTPRGTRHYARVRCTDTAGNTGAWSDSRARRYVHAGRVRQDFNGDGYSDTLVVSGGNSRNAYLFLGGPGLDAVPDLILSESASYYGTGAAFVDDVNADGYADIAIGAHGENFYTGKVFLYLGSSSPNSVADQVISGTLGSYSNYGSALAPAGDANGDGFADVAVGAPGKASVVLLSGGGSLNTIAGGTVTGGSYLGDKVYGFGDVNGDGFSDYLAASPSYDDVVLVFGDGVSPGNSSIAIAVEDQFGGQNGSYFGEAAAFGDRNGDHLADFVVGAPLHGSYPGYEGRIYFFDGNSGWSSSSNDLKDASYVQTGGTGTRFGDAIDWSGDLDNDGLLDLLISATESSQDSVTESGTLKIYTDRDSGSTICPSSISYDYRIRGMNPGDKLGYSVSSPGDMNGDGKEDIVVSSIYYDLAGQDDAGAAYIYFFGDGLFETVGNNTTTYRVRYTGSSENEKIGFRVD